MSVDKKLEQYTCMITFHAPTNFKACIVNMPPIKSDYEEAVYSRLYVTPGKAVMVICYEGKPTTEFIRAILQGWKRGEWTGINSKGHVIPDRVKRAYGLPASPKPKASKREKRR